MRSGDDMPREVRARFSKGRIEPFEELHLQEGEEVVILVKDKPEKKTEPDGFELAAGGWVGSVDTDELLRLVQKSRKVVSPPIEL